MVVMALEAIGAIARGRLARRGPLDQIALEGGPHRRGSGARLGVLSGPALDGLAFGPAASRAPGVFALAGAGSFDVLEIPPPPLTGLARMRSPSRASR
jgi:hypothetical protein